MIFSRARALAAATRDIARRANEVSTPGDLRIARTVGGAFWASGALVGALLLPFDPPTHAVGRPGWIVAGAMLAGCLAIAYSRLGTRREPSLVEIYVAGYFGLAAIAVLEWLAGGRDSAYHYLYLLPLLYAAAAHRRSRVLGFMAAVAIVIWAPLLYQRVTEQLVVDIATQLLTLLGLGIAVWLLFVVLRIQRAAVREAQQQAEQAARRDYLTGLGNRRAFVEALELEIARARRSGAPLSVILADLDRFKRVNDMAGHAGGDRCLRRVAEAIERTTRAGDVCFRWGGDEFAVLLPGTDRTDAERLCERIRAAVRGACATSGKEPTSITCGAAQLCGDQGPDDLLIAADDILLALKLSRPEATSRPAESRARLN